MYEGFRISHDFYTILASSLLTETLSRLPTLKEVRVDNDPGVSRDGPLVTEILDVARMMVKNVGFGPNGAKPVVKEWLPLINDMAGFYSVFQ